MFEENNRVGNESIDNTDEAIGETNLEANVTEEKTEDSRLSRKVYKVRATLAICVVCVILLVVNWGSIMTTIDLIGAWLDRGISNPEGITEFPEAYEDVYSKIQMLGSEDDDDISNAPEFDDSVIFPQLEGFYKTEMFDSKLEGADSIKYDGKYIYAVFSDGVYIMTQTNGDIKTVSKIETNGEGETLKGTNEIFVYGNYLVVMNSVNTTGLSSKGENRVIAEIYNISNKSKPELYNTVGQSGEYLASYMVDNVLYLVSKHKVVSAKEEKPETYVPLLYNNDKSDTVGFSDICMYNDISNAEYTVISGFDIGKGGKIVSNKSLLGYGSSVYMNSGSLYVTSNRTKFLEDKKYNSTDITRLVLNKGEISFKASANIPGFVMNKSAMSEYDGEFRVVTLLYGKEIDKSTTSFDTTFSTAESEYVSIYDPDTDLLDSKYVTCIYKLDGKLRITGCFENIFPEEPVGETYFVKNMLYMVAGEDSDLYVVNLDELKKEEIEDDLEIESFPNCITPYKDSVVIGIENDDEVNLCAYKLSNELVKIDSEELDNIGDNAHIAKVDGEYIVVVSELDCIVYKYSEKKGFSTVAEIEFDEEITDGVEKFYDNSDIYISGDCLYVYVDSTIQTYSLKKEMLTDKVSY